MGKRGVKPKGKVKIKWSPNFAYAIGLLVTDGSVANNRRHITFVSKDMEQINNFTHALKISVPTSYTRSGYAGRLTPRVQFGDKLFCEFLQSIGISPNKTKTIGIVLVPDKYFFDFLRGHLDGDGSIYTYNDKRWGTFMIYTNFVSASKEHIIWIQKQIQKSIGITGHISHAQRSSVYQLRYAKRESLVLWKYLYTPHCMALSRKRLKIREILRIIAKQQKLQDF